MGYQKLTPIVATGATAPRYLGDRFADFVNVRDFGAKGDGTTNDTAAFQAAVTAANGKAVFVPQGSYNIQSAVSGLFVSDGIVNASNITVFSVTNNNRYIELLKEAQSLCSPSQQFSFNDYLSIGSSYFYQSACYDSKREVFLLGAKYLNDDAQSGYIKKITDLLDPTSLVSSTSVAGGHFNDMDYDEDNDVVYLCPGSSQPNKLLVLDPSTLAISQEKTMDGDMWTASVKNGYLYTVQNNYLRRYSTETFTIDNNYSFEIGQNISLAHNEAKTSQGSFIVGNVFVLIWTITSTEATESYGQYRRVVYDCIDLDSGYSSRVSFPCSVYNELECAVVKNNILYQLAVNSSVADIYITPLHTAYTGDNVNKSLAVVDNVSYSINSFISPGLFYIYSGGVLTTLAPDVASGWGAMCGCLNVENICTDGTRRQTLTLKNGLSIVFQKPDKSTTDNGQWFQEGYFAPYVGRNGVNIENCGGTPGLHCFTNVANLPEGSNGWIVTYGAGETPSKDTYQVYKQIYYRWGTIGTNDSDTYIRTGTKASTSSSIEWGSWVKVITEKTSFNNDFAPDSSKDNTYNLGGSGKRWKQLYAGTSTIATSDEREKENIEDIEQKLLNAWGNVSFKVFQFKDAVNEKGQGARKHIGVIAQNIQKAFSDEGLDAGKYGLFCYDKWEDEYSEDEIIDNEAVYEDGFMIAPAKTHIERTKIQSAGDRFSVRYEEALALECAYLRSRMSNMQEQIDNLTALVSQLTSQNNK